METTDQAKKTGAIVLTLYQLTSAWLHHCIPRHCREVIPLIAARFGHQNGSQVQSGRLPLVEAVLLLVVAKRPTDRLWLRSIPRKLQESRLSVASRVPMRSGISPVVVGLQSNTSLGTDRQRHVTCWNSCHRSLAMGKKRQLYVGFVEHGQDPARNRCSAAGQRRATGIAQIRHSYRRLAALDRSQRWTFLGHKVSWTLLRRRVVGAKKGGRGKGCPSWETV